jgi:hypothetical protein
MRVLLLLVNTLINIIALLTGGIFYIDYKLSWKYKVLILVLPTKYLPSGSVCLPDLLGGMILLEDKIIMQDNEICNFTILHEKGHCRCWEAMPNYTNTPAHPHHGKTTAEFEYAADLYAVTHGADIHVVIESFLDDYDYMCKHGEAFELQNYSKEDALHRALRLQQMMQVDNK